jgi:O-antigen ligase
MNKQIIRNIIFTGLFLVPLTPFLVSSSFFFPFISTKAFAWRVIVEVVFAAWLLLMLMAPEYRPKKSIILYAFVAFVAVIGLADLLGVAPVKSFWSNYERMEGFVTLLHLGAFFLVIGSVFNEINWRRWWNTSLAASFLMVIYSAFQLAGTLEIHQGGARVDGTLGNASYLAVYMLFHIFIALLFLWREKKNASLRWVYGILAILQTWVLYHTATRGAILGLIGGLFIVAFLNIRNKEDRWLRKLSLALIAGLIVVVGGVALARDSEWVKNSMVLSRFASISTEELKGGGRSFVWPMAWEGIKERPLLGWGQDNFNYVFNEHYDPEMYMLEPWFDRAHNIFLDWGVAGGFLGLFSYLALYVAFLWVVWKGNTGLAYEERSILTALLAAYFFHNLFVFDQLISYILFASLLAYVYTRSDESIARRPEAAKEAALNGLLMPAVIVVLLASLYWVNLKPIMANSTLIEAMTLLQGSPEDKTAAIGKFKRAYSLSRLGRPEAVEQIVGATPTILSSSLSNEVKNDFYNFAKTAVTEQAADAAGDARYQILAGNFFNQTGSTDEGIRYLEEARKLMPGKQLVYFELGSALINKGDAQGALQVFKAASELAPGYLEAKKVYLIGAIHAGDRVLESALRAEIPEREIVFDDRLISAYYTKGRFPEVIQLLERRAAFDPANAATYQEYIKQVREASRN